MFIVDSFANLGRVFRRPVSFVYAQWAKPPKKQSVGVYFWWYVSVFWML